MRKKIAIIGSGISGLSAAYFLKNRCDVTLYEQEPRLGGHSRTIRVHHNSGHVIDVDTGFIVFNDKTYPHLNKLFKELQIEIEKTEMSFAVSLDQGKLEWSGNNLDTFFAQKKRLFSLSMLKGGLDVLRFNRTAQKRVLKEPNLTLAEFLDAANMGSWFRNCYLLPMGGAIWSCSAQQMEQFPASTFVNFFNNHGLLTLTDRPQWYTAKNKSAEYVGKIEKALPCVKKGVDIKTISRGPEGVRITTQETAIFDEVIFACHPQNILSLLQDVSSDEKEILSKFSKQKNIAYTHSDEAHMPRLRKCWSSWNCLYDGQTQDHPVSMTYWMNRLQHIPSHSPLFVTLNPLKQIPEEKIYDVCEFYHPLFDKKSLEGQKQIDSIQGTNRTWFCGAYLRHGFHEDGIWSTVTLLEKMYGPNK